MSNFGCNFFHASMFSSAYCGIGAVPNQIKCKIFGIVSKFLSILMRYLIDYCGSVISSIRIGSVKSSYGISGVIDAMNNCAVPIYSITITCVNNDNAIDNIDTAGTLSIDLQNNNIFLQL